MTLLLRQSIQTVFSALLTCFVMCAILPAAEATRTSSFQAIAKPFLLKHCVECHGDDEQEGDIRLDLLDPAKFKDDAMLWHKVIKAVSFAKMPPEEVEQPDPQTVQQLTSWIEMELAAIGQESDVAHRMRQPTYANLLNHDRLFDESTKHLAYSPPRLWRLHPQAYDAFLEGFGRELGIGGPLSKPFTQGDGKGQFRNYASLMKADSATLSQLMLNCKQIAQLQTVGFTRTEMDRRTKKMVERRYRKPPETFDVIFQSESAPTDEQIAAAVTEEFALILNRPPSEQEATSFTDLTKKSIEIGGKERGLQTMAMAVLLRPETIYRMEIGLGQPDQHDRRMLSPYELAYAIAYALTDTPPDEIMLGAPKPGDRHKRPLPPSLLDLADQGGLRTREDVQKIVTMIWQNDQIEKPRILRFFREFFGYHAAESVFKGDRAGKEFMARHLVDDADQLVMHIVNKDHDVLKELLTTDQYFVSWPGSVEEYDRRIKYITTRIKPDNTKDRNYKYFVTRVQDGLKPMPQANPTWRKTVRFYNLNEETWDYPVEQPFSLPDRQRIGILTHPTWLAAWSGNFDNDPIRRGKWIREHLLAGSIPDVPITVDASVPEDPHKTLRQRLEKTREAYCWKCHQKMEPLGLPFEAYDDFGQFRTVEGLGHTKALQKPKSTAPVVTIGQIIKSGDATIDGTVQDVHELMHRLANSERVRQSFVRHAFRYWLGRNERLTDSSTMVAADKAYVDGQGSFQALVISLLTSDSFLYRK